MVGAPSLARATLGVCIGRVSLSLSSKSVELSQDSGIYGNNQVKFDITPQHTFKKTFHLLLLIS